MVSNIFRISSSLWAQALRRPGVAVAEARFSFFARSFWSSMYAKQFRVKTKDLLRCECVKNSLLILDLSARVD